MGSGSTNVKYTSAPLQDYYEVLQLANGSEALEESVLKRARREKMLLVHPDKTGRVPGGNEAFDAVSIVRPILTY